jgi:hypothetical protein
MMMTTDVMMAMGTNPQTKIGWYNTFYPKVVGASDLSPTRVISPITGKSNAVVDAPASRHQPSSLKATKLFEGKYSFGCVPTSKLASLGIGIHLGLS